MLKIITLALIAFVAGLFLKTLLVADRIPGAAPEDVEKLSIANSMVTAWNTKNWQQVADLFTEDGVLHSMMQEPVVGREAIRTRILALGAGVETITLKIRNKGVVNDVVVLERVDEFVYKGHKGAVPVVGVLEFENGLIKEWREYYDHHDLLKNMGLVLETTVPEKEQSATVGQAAVKQETKEPEAENTETH